MTGAVQASAGIAAGASFSYSIGIGHLVELAAGAYGFTTAPFVDPGSISPVGTLKGATIISLRSISGSEDLLVWIQGLRAQSFWRQLVIQDTGGVWTPLNSSGANYFQSAGDTFWRYGIGSFPYWTATVPTPRGLIFFP